MSIYQSNELMKIILVRYSVEQSISDDTLAQILAPLDNMDKAQQKVYKQRLIEILKEEQNENKIIEKSMQAASL